MTKGVIFDADGTLLDSMHIWNEVGARYLISVNKIPQEGLCSILFPMTLEEGSIYLKEHYDLNESPEEIKAGVLGIIDGFYRNEVGLKPGVKSFLEYLRQRGIKAVVATTSDKVQIEAAFVRLGIREYFEAIFTCSELNTSKREPKIYIASAEYLGTKPDETAVFEDVLYALKTAKHSGFTTVAVEDAQSAESQKEIMETADIYIRDFTDPVLYNL